MVRKGGVSLRSRLGILGVRVSTRLAGKPGLEVNSQSGFYTALDRESHHFLLLLLLWRSRKRRRAKAGDGQDTILV